jgi:ATP-dependent RNA helicase MSS116, mitochondrial
MKAFRSLITTHRTAMVRQKAAIPRKRGGARGFTEVRSPETNKIHHAPPPVFAPPPASNTNGTSKPVSSRAMSFADLATMKILHPTLIQTITDDLRLERMTDIQEATIKELLQERIDCLAQAKTGTGKTIAFLLPALQRLLTKPRQANKISLLVISPTRELAIQIAKEAESLLTRVPQYNVCYAIGGTNKDREEREILSHKGCDVLVATPGRLKDHLSNPDIVDAFSSLDTLVLDEADRLLDMGFLRDLKEIISYLPDKNATGRHGMLFSATIAGHVKEFAHVALRSNYKFVSTIPPEEATTHERVKQDLITVPTFTDVLPATVAAIQREAAAAEQGEFKAILFAPTASIVDWYTHTLSSIPGLPPVSTLHSRMTQSKRTRIADDFRTSKQALLIATDVVARGMDFPNVTTVVQVGLPQDRESYIHRLGRTARAGRNGKGVFIVAQAESFFPTYRLKDIPFVHTDPAITDQHRQAVFDAATKSDIQGKVYQTWLGYYKNHVKALGWSLEQLVAEANRYAIDGLVAGGVPEIPRNTIGKMGLKAVKGLNVGANPSHTVSGAQRNGNGGRPSGGRAPAAGRGRGRG